MFLVLMWCRDKIPHFNAPIYLENKSKIGTKEAEAKGGEQEDEKPFLQEM